MAIALQRSSSARLVQLNSHFWAVSGILSSLNHALRGLKVGTQPVAVTLMNSAIVSSTWSRFFGNLQPLTLAWTFNFGLNLGLSAAPVPVPGGVCVAQNASNDTESRQLKSDYSPVRLVRYDLPVVT
jgi:hypothetical protein